MRVLACIATVLLGVMDDLQSTDGTSKLPETRNAEQGDTVAQRVVGGMDYNGQLVLQDYADAAA